MKQTACVNTQAPGVQQHLFSVANRFIARMCKTMHAWKQRKATRTDLARLSVQELDDVGITDAQRLNEVNKPFWKA